MNENTDVHNALLTGHGSVCVCMCDTGTRSITANPNLSSLIKFQHFFGTTISDDEQNWIWFHCTLELHGLPTVQQFCRSSNGVQLMSYYRSHVLL